MLSAEAPNLSWRSRVTSAVAVAPFPSGVSAETGRHVSEPSDPDTAYHADPTETLSQRRADALARFAETYLSHGLQAMTGGERHQVVVHVDAETLAQRTPGRCTLEDGPAMGAETARRLSCDASIVTLAEDAAGNPLDVGRKTRSISPALSRALRTRDGGCRFPGCGHKRFVDGHHIRHWADGGHTRLSNLVLLCRFHHRQVHEGGITVQMLGEQQRNDRCAASCRADGWVSNASSLSDNATRVA